MQRSPIRALAVFLLATAFTVACGGDPPGIDAEAFRRACAEVPGCERTSEQETAPREAIYRVEVIRQADGGVRIGEVDSVDVVAGKGVPVAPLTGSHMLLGLDDAGDPVDGQLVAFPRILRAETGGDWPETVETDLSEREVSTFGYVRAVPEVVELGVRNRSGEIVNRVATPSMELALGGSDDGSTGGGLMVAGPSGALLAGLQDGAPDPSPRDLPPDCSHIRILEGETDWHLAGWVAEEVTELHVPGPTQRAVIHSALGRMTPLLCHGTSRIAVGSMPAEPGVGGQVRRFTAGDLLFINSATYPEEELAGSRERQLRMIHTVIHETAHAAETLLNAEGSRPRSFGGEWQPEARSLAAETIANVRLERSLFEEWQLVHRSFERQGWAEPYMPEKDAVAEDVYEARRAAARARSAAETATAGFMSRYAGKSYAEDIADTVAWLYMGDEYRAAGIPDGKKQTEDYGCQQMQVHSGDGVPARFAALYTKVHFLEDLGLARAEDVERCTGPVELPNDEPGFHFWQDDEYRRSFGMAVEAIIGTAPSGNYVFEMTAEGEAEFGDETYPASVRLRLQIRGGGVPVELVPWPRGVYELDALAGYDLGTASRLGATDGSGFSLRLDGKAAGNFDVYDGFALVAEASNERIAGSIVIRRAWRLQAPIPVPQTFDPPLVVRFAIEK